MAIWDSKFSLGGTGDSLFSLYDNSKSRKRNQSRYWGDIVGTEYPRPTTQVGGTYNMSTGQRTGGREVPYFSEQEIMSGLADRFNAQPVEYEDRGDYRVATKSMQAPELPQEIAGSNYREADRWSDYFGDELSTQWIIPEGVGEDIQATNVPTSDAQRQRANRMGFENTGGQAARVNPSTYFPESNFQVPMMESTAGFDVPRFGSTVNLAEGEIYNQPAEPRTQMTPYGMVTDTPYDTSYQEISGRTMPGYGEAPAMPGIEYPSNAGAMRQFRSDWNRRRKADQQQTIQSQRQPQEQEVSPEQFTPRFGEYQQFADEIRRRSRIDEIMESPERGQDYVNSLYPEFWKQLRDWGAL